MESVHLLHTSSGVQREGPRHFFRNSFRCTQMLTWQTWCFRLVPYKANEGRPWQEYFEDKFSHTLFLDYLSNEQNIIKYFKHQKYPDLNFIFDDSEDTLGSECHQVVLMNISDDIESACECWLKIPVSKFAVWNATETCVSGHKELACRR